MTRGIRARLGAMYFLEYLIKGAWLPLLGLYMGPEYLGFSAPERAWVFNAFAIASITGMFFGGQLADRLMDRRHFLAACHGLGGLAVMGLSQVREFGPFFGLMLLHCFFYVPTLSVANAVAFANLGGDRRDFGAVRLWGSIGAAAGAWPLIFIPIDWARVPPWAESGGPIGWLGVALKTLKTGPALEGALGGTFVVSGLASLLLAAWSLTLPRAPAAAGGRGERFAPWGAIRLLARPAVAVLFAATCLDSMVHYAYYIWSSRYFQSLGVPVNWIAPAMSIAQISEVFAMAALGRVIRRLGWRRTMILGVLSQAVRFAVYSIGTPGTVALVIGVNVVHGLTYACFFAAVYIFVDATFPEGVRASAQGLFNLMILGIAQFAANFAWGGLGERLTRTVTEGGRAVAVVDFHRLFLFPCGTALAAAVLLALFFRPDRDEGAAA